LGTRQFPIGKWTIALKAWEVNGLGEYVPQANVIDIQNHDASPLNDDLSIFRDLTARIIVERTGLCRTGDIRKDADFSSYT
jgi:hypothetical protein